MTYVEGVVDLHEFQSKSGKMAAEFCMTKSTTVGEMKDLVEAQLIRYKNGLGLMASFYVISALRNAFPCSVQDSGN